MATTTPNFSWAVPTSTDLVKDGALAIETLGDAIDGRFGDVTNFPNQIVNRVSSVSRPLPYATAAGLLTVTSTSSSQAYTVTLPASRFSVTPIVTLGQNIGRGISNYVVASSSNTSIQITVATPVSGGAATSAGNINWLAIQMTSTAAGA
jgi:hypothetical protein